MATTFERQGVKIQVDDHGDFVWTDKLGHAHRHDSLALAEKAIAKEVRAEAVTKRETVSLACVDKNGNSMNATGINARTGNVMTTGDTNRIGTLYPDTPDARKAIAELKRLETEVEKIEEVLRTMRVDDLPYVHGELDDVGHAGRVGQLKALHARASKVKYSK